MPSRRCLALAVALLACGCLSTLSAQTAAAAPAALANPSAAPEDADAISAQAHALLARALRVNGPSVEGAAPWHLKADFQWQTEGQPVDSGVVEEWWKSPYEWRRTWTFKKTVWTEWSVDLAHQFQSPGIFPSRGFFELRITTPLITPLFQAKNFLPEYPMEMKAVGNGSDLSCITITDPSHFISKIDPDFLFPKYCLDKAGVLRGVVTSNTLVTFADFQIVDKRAIAKTVDVFVDGHKVSESKVSLLEPLSVADSAQLQPARDAVPEPFSPAASDPRPVLIHSERPIIPANLVIAGNGGPVRLGVIIGKDGKVRPNFAMAGTGGTSLIGACADAARGFRYEPYLVDGQPVEVAWSITFALGRNGYEAPPKTESDIPTGYDPKRDPAADLKNAEAEAQQAHKHIILEVGGAWCIWCAYMDHFFTDHPDIDELMKASYVVVKVNWSQENHNEAFLSQYADVNSFPFLIVLDEHGKVLQLERTNVLEKGNSYDPDKMKDFLNHWKPAQPPTA